jgi:hypothetical protein
VYHLLSCSGTNILQFGSLYKHPFVPSPSPAVYSSVFSLVLLNPPISFWIFVFLNIHRLPLCLSTIPWRCTVRWPILYGEVSGQLDTPPVFTTGKNPQCQLITKRMDHRIDLNNVVLGSNPGRPASYRWTLLFHMLLHKKQKRNLVLWCDTGKYA